MLFKAFGHQRLTFYFWLHYYDILFLFDWQEALNWYIQVVSLKASPVVPCGTLSSCLRVQQHHNYLHWLFMVFLFDALLLFLCFLAQHFIWYVVIRVYIQLSSAYTLFSFPNGCIFSFRNLSFLVIPLSSFPSLYSVFKEVSANSVSSHHFHFPWFTLASCPNEICFLSWNLPLFSLT